MPEEVTANGFTRASRTSRIVCNLLAALSITLPAALAEDSIEGRYLSNLRQVTSGFVRAGEGYFSPDGSTIVYQAVRDGYPFYQIYLQELIISEQGTTGEPPIGNPLRISTGRGRTTCSFFSRDGERILFASSHLDPQLDRTEEEVMRQAAEDRQSGRRRRYEWVFDAHMDLFVADRNGNLQARLTAAAGYDAECAYSPDGQEIVFCSTRDGDPDLYIMRSDGSEVRQITNLPGYDGGPFFSPNGEWIVFRTDREEQDRLQIHIIRKDGTGEFAVTSNPNQVNWAPYWHPVEPYLIWCGADHSDPAARPNYDLWLMRYSLDGDRFEPGQVRRITDHLSADVLPVFSPDGRQLMWTSGRAADGSSQLWLADFRLPSEQDSGSP